MNSQYTHIQSYDLSHDRTLIFQLSKVFHSFFILIFYSPFLHSEFLMSLQIIIHVCFGKEAKTEQEQAAVSCFKCC